MTAKVKKKHVLAIGIGFHISKTEGDTLIDFIKTHFKGRVPRGEPEKLVAAAKPANSPIHSLFEWNDKKAAALERKRRAEYLLRAVKRRTIEVTVGTTKKGKVVEVPQAVAVKHKGHRAVVHVQAGELTTTNINYILDRALVEFRSWLNRYRNYAEFMNLFDPVIAEFEKVEEYLETKGGRHKKSA